MSRRGSPGFAGACADISRPHYARRVNGAFRRGCRPQQRAAPASAHLLCQERRILAWDGCVNVRDLGGLPLAGGGETAYGVLVRSDALPSLSITGRDALVAYGVSLVVDLRAEHEYSPDSVEALPIPVRHEPMDPWVVPAVQEWTSMREAYLSLIDRFRSEFARVLTALGNARPPAAVHCQSGRDRTGIACGLALWLAGVTSDAISADHALSDEILVPRNEAWFASATDEREQARRRRIAAPAHRTLAAVLQAVDERKGIRAFLLGAGADATALDRLAARLRAGPAG
jgi:protein-tyrosine phosphatase